MRIARTKNALKNIAVGFVLRIYQMLVPFFMRTAMIYFMGVQYLGLNSLFSSVLHVLNLAELGVGSAMVFSMYKPIAEDDTETICALMKLYRRYYRMIGLVIGTAGIVLTPVVPKLISGEVPAELNVYVLYWLNLGATVLTYWLFAYRNCILQAHQRMDVVNIVLLVTSTIQYGLQLAVILWSKDYYLYVIVLLFTTILNNVLTAAVAAWKYPQYKPKGTLPKQQIRQINGKIRDLFTGKIGSVVLSSADTIVISAFLGLTILAIYQNYYFILTSVIAIVEMLMASIRAGLGNSFVTESREKNYRDFEKFTFLYMWGIGIGACCFLGMYQPFVELWVGRELMLGYTEVICFAVYFYVYSLNKLLNVYKDAAGLWHEDRFRPLITASVNLGLNLCLVQRFGLIGVILSTVLSQIVVGIPWVLHNLFRLFFNPQMLKRYVSLLVRYLCVSVIAGAAVCMICCRLACALWLRLLLGMLISVLLPSLIYWALYRKMSVFKEGLQFINRIAGSVLKRPQHQ